MFDATTYLIIPTTGLTAEAINGITALALHRIQPVEDAAAAGNLSASTAPSPPVLPHPVLPPPSMPSPSAARGLDSEWSLADLYLVLDRLARSTNGWLRGLAVKAALDGDGTVTRERIHELGHPADKMLKGFARPVETAVSALISEGLLTQGKRARLLTPDYDGGAVGTAVGYHVPRQVLELWRSAHRSELTPDQAA